MTNNQDSFKEFEEFFRKSLANIAPPKKTRSELIFTEVVRWVFGAGLAGAIILLLAWLAKVVFF